MFLEILFVIFGYDIWFYILHIIMHKHLYSIHHLLHHKHPSYNYGEYWIDLLCGTTYPNDEEYEYGMIYM